MAVNTDLGMPPDFFVGNGLKRTQLSNPWYSISKQYVPLSQDLQFWYSNFFLSEYEFYRAALGRIANYFITSLKIECDDSDSKKKYTEIFEKMKWKERLFIAGLDLLAYGNVFASIAQGFTRFLKCSNPQCNRITNIDKLEDYEFDNKGHYAMYCKACKQKSVHECIDKPSKDLEKLEIIYWNVRQIKVRFDRATNAAEYYWDIPQEYAARVTAVNNKFYSKKTPKAIYDAIYAKKLLAFNQKNFIHLKVPTPSGVPTEGKAVPYCIYMFNQFFTLKVIERYNETIMYEDIVPFRVFSIAQQTNSNPQQNMMLMQNAGQWKQGIENMIAAHRQDPGSYHMFPFQFQFDKLGGDATKLAPTEFIQQTKADILNAYSIPQELYNMTLQIQAVGPALRLFENSWSFMIDMYNTMIQEWGDIVGKISGLPKAKIGLMPVTLADDIERKSIIGQLVSSNSIARSELLGLYQLDFREQLRKKQEEDTITQEMQEEAALKQQVQQLAQTGGQGGSQQGGQTPSDVQSKAQQIAQQLYGLPPEQRRQQLQQIKANDETLWSCVKSQLQQLTSQAKSQGNQQAQQQSAQQGQ